MKRWKVHNVPKIMSDELAQDRIGPSKQAWVPPRVRRLQPDDALLRELECHDPAFARAAREMVERNCVAADEPGPLRQAGARRR
jgi:hypothetical protein